MKSLFLIMICLCGWSCSNISMIEPEKKDLYSAKFLEQVNLIKGKYKNQDTQGALHDLNGLDDSKISAIEKALKYNLIGVIVFSQKNFEKAAIYFGQSSETSSEDERLNSQVYLNLGSTYFKLENLPESYRALTKIDFNFLDEVERKKFFQLGLIVSKRLGHHSFSITSLIRLIGDKQTINDVQNDKYFEELTQLFFRITFTERMNLLETFEEGKYLSVGYLAFLQLEKLQYSEEKSSISKIAEYISQRYKEFPELINRIERFQDRASVLAKMDSQAIGVVLPFSGEHSNFAKRAMLGIDGAFAQYQLGLNDPEMTKAPPTIYTKDSFGSGVVGAKSVQELVEKNMVSLIIGGLFSSEATNEYLEAKKHGVFFISLSQIYLPKEEKDHLLLEIPGSVESQISRLLSDDVLEQYGKNVSVIYPNSLRGETYVNEFWRVSRLKGVKLSGVQSYEKSRTDFRDPVKKLLGLKFLRERQEEHDLWQSIHALRGKSSTRRIQTLAPKIDFDWVFIPAFPKEAIQLIPSFSYYDAFHLSFFGGPSWRSKVLAESSNKYGNLNFIGNDLENEDGEFQKFKLDFTKRYKRRPRLIETMSYDAMKIVRNILSKEGVESRSDLNSYLQDLGDIKGLTGNWRLVDGVWMKDMEPLILYRGRVRRALEGRSS